MTAAQQEHQRLGTPMHERVPVFDVIEDARIWLFFRPMRNLYGAYERRGDAAGIIINSQHPLSLQRYTAAHEYGHHVLGHEASADDEERIYRGDRQTMQEVAAQAFAGEFLMPIQLVNYVIRAMGLSIQRPKFSPAELYQLALRLGVSYMAVLTQLVVQRKLPNQTARRLRRLSPLDIKTGLVGAKPADSWADVWLLDDSQKGWQVVSRLRDEIHVRLSETPSTGYVWDLVDSASGLVEVVANRFEVSGTDEEEIGTSGMRHLWLRVVSPGSGQIRLELRRPWLADTKPVRTFQAALDALPPLTGDVVEGATVEQRKGVLQDFQVAAA
jgi:Zn-dependent peptidase ImmA (M78 family)/predicted secreted protein